MMRTTHKFLSIFTASLLALLASGLANAALIGFTITGTVEPHPNPGGVSLLPIGSTITATGTFDDNNAPLNGTIYFNSGSGNSLSINLGSLGTLNETHDTRYNTALPNSGPLFTFASGVLTGFDYSAFTGTNSAPITFTSFNLIFDNDVLRTLRGTWDSANAVFVPVPAAVWLFGSGLIGLAGVARRKHST